MYSRHQTKGFAYNDSERKNHVINNIPSFVSNISVVQNPSSLSPRNISDYNDEEEMYVITRTGKKELLDTNKITNRLRSLINRNPKIPHVNPSQLMLEVSKGLKSRISTYEIDEYAANASASASVTNPYYLKVAARIAIDNHQKNTIRSFVDKMRKAYLYVDEEDDIISPFLSEEFIKYVEENQDSIEKTIDYSKDFLLDFFGIRTFQKNFSMKINEKPIERPQDMFMRTAVALHMNTESKKVRRRMSIELRKLKSKYDPLFENAKFTTAEDKDELLQRVEKEYNEAVRNIQDKYSILERNAVAEELKNVEETYYNLSNKYYTHASPTYYNSGSTRQQFASCFLQGSGDSRKDIMHTADNISKISKWAGGIGIHVNEWRGTGARIRSTKGRSSGIVPFLQHYQTALNAFNQGGRRPGSAAIYLSPHHPDILKFIQLPRNGGADEDRARKIFTALWMPDLFMKRVKEEGIWSLFDPNRTYDLSQLWGEEYEKKYIELEQARKYVKQIPARELWEQILETNRDVGYPYLCYGDTANRLNMQKNLGVLKSSNLCVSGDTLILTRNGYCNIKTLSETNNGMHEIWNGFEFSKAKFAKTGTAKSLLKITFSDGVELKCTPQHKFATLKNYTSSSYIEKQASELKIGDKLIKHDWPIIDNDDNDFKYPYTHGFFCGDGTYNEKKGEGIKCHREVQENSAYCHYHAKCYKEDTPDITGICKAMTSRRTPLVDLYDIKKDLLSYLEYIKIGDSNDTRIRLNLHFDIEPKYTVPMHKSLEIKLKWLSGYIDADGTFAKNGDAWSLQISSINKEFLMQVKLLCNTVGVNPLMQIMHEPRQDMLPDGNGGSKLYDCQRVYRLCFSAADTSFLYELGLDTKRLKWNNKELPMRSKKQYIQIKSIEKLDTLEDTYCFNEPERHMGIFNGVLTKNCSEIFIHSNKHEYGVCVLSSIALPMFVLDGYSEEELKLPENERRELNHEFPKNPYFDFRKFMNTVNVVTKNLNIIVDKTYHPCKESKRGNNRHRPIGIGVQGLADCYLKMRFPYASPEARKLNKEIFEALYFAALTQSTKLARKDYLEIRKECRELGEVTVETYMPNDYKTHYVTYTDPDSIPTKIGAYSSIDWNGGSPYTHGQFHWELAGLKKEDLSGMFDWDNLREHILKFGVKNSLLVALMPTASTSQLLGNNECFEPYTSNVYKRSTLAGEYIVINKFLMNDLYNLGIWNSTIKSYLLATNGSIQYIEGIPDSLKQLYRTVLEIGMDEIIQQAIDRQPFVDQGQSLNWYVDNINKKDWNRYAFKAFKGGLKTAKYYMHSQPAAMPQKFTIDPKKQEEMMKLLEKNQHGTAFMDRLHEVCDVCSG